MNFKLQRVGMKCSSSAFNLFLTKLLNEWQTYLSKVEHYTRDADGLCVNLRKPCVQVIFKTPRAIFNQQQWSTIFLSIWRLMKFRILPRGLIMKSKLAQFPRRWLKPIVGPFWGARVSPAEFISLPLRYFYQHIHLTQFANHQLDGSNFHGFPAKKLFLLLQLSNYRYGKIYLTAKKIVNFSIFCPLLSYDELSFSPTQL